MNFLEFGYIPDRDMSAQDIAILRNQAIRANETMELLSKGKLSLDDAIALCESIGCDPDHAIDSLYDNFEFLGII